MNQPEALTAALDRGWSIIPLNRNKRPRMNTWVEYQKKAPSPALLEKWERAKPPAYAVCTGEISGVVVIDFDGEPGEQWVQAWRIRPHVITGSGGAHLYLPWPGWKVKTLNAKSDKWLQEHYPGVDIRADGGYAVFWNRERLQNNAGELHPALYRNVRPFDELAVNFVTRDMPADLAKHFGLLAPVTESEPQPPTEAVSDPLYRFNESALQFLERQLTAHVALSRSGRDNAGFLFACQLRDAGVSQAEAPYWMSQFASRVSVANQHGDHEPWTDADSRQKIKSAYSQAPREAARDRSKAAPPLPTPPPFKAEVGEFIANARKQPAPMPARSAGRPPKTKYECGFHDVGNAERFVMRCGHAVRYCHAWGKWLVYDGQRWIRDGEAKAKQMVIETMREIHIQAAQASIDGDEAKCKKLNAWATASLSQRAISAALSLAATFPEIAIEPDELDANPWVMNCQNGTLDLVTCRLKPHRSEDLLTKLAPVDYDPDAKAPQWEAYVAQMMLGRPGLIDYLKRALGYALTGDVTEKALFLCYGGGDNGKTTMLEVFRHVCGDYAGAIQIESLLHTKSQSGRDASPDIAALLGKRFITTSEADEGARLNESRIKYLTGMGEIVARELHHEQFSFKPQFKLFLDTNYRPVIRGTDKGIWTRMRSIPFELQLTEEQKDKGLGERLKAEEASGILAWAIEGLMLYHESGIPAPEEVAAATAEYKHQMDSLGEFLEECTTVDPTLRAPARALYRCYQIFVKTSGEMPFGEKRFKASMLERGFGQVRTDEGMRYVGLALSRTVSDSGELTPVSSWS